MKTLLCTSFLLISCMLAAQVPVASFSVSPNPVCAGKTVQITDLSVNSPTAWSYTISSSSSPVPFLPLTAQHPTFTLNQPGTYSITLIAKNSAGASQPVSQLFTILPVPNGQIVPQSPTTCPQGNPVTFAVLGGGPGAMNNLYLWSNSATTPSITVTPSVTTVYHVTVTGTNGCTLVRSTTLTVAPATVTITALPQNICPGISTTLAASITAPQPFTFSWNTGAATRTISTNVPGVFNVTVTNGNGCTGTQSITIVTSTTLALSAIANPSVICAGNQANLAAQGAATYTWSNGANAATQMVNPNLTTVYSVTGAIGSCTGVTSQTLTVNHTPTITTSSSPASICAGDQATITAVGADNYTWMPGSLNGSAIAVSPAAMTTYTIRGVNQGCPQRTVMFSMIVYAVPDITVSTSSSLICTGEQAAIGAAGAQSFTWNTGSTNGVLLVSPVTTTTYSVTGVSAAGCTSTATYVQHVSDCSGFSEANTGSSISIFPNPSSGTFSITVKQPVHLSVLDAQGKLMARQFVTGSTVVSGLSPGLYFVISDGAAHAFRIVIQ